jgi:hypothetical protein
MPPSSLLLYSKIVLDNSCSSSCSLFALIVLCRQSAATQLHGTCVLVQDARC